MNLLNDVLALINVDAVQSTLDVSSCIFCLVLFPFSELEPAGHGLLYPVVDILLSGNDEVVRFRLKFEQCIAHARRT